jgi:hypothetical protein
MSAWSQNGLPFWCVLQPGVLHGQMYSHPLSLFQSGMQLLGGTSTNDLDGSSLPEVPFSSFCAKTCWGTVNAPVDFEGSYTEGILTPKSTTHNFAEVSALLDVEEVVTFRPRRGK